MGLSLLGLHDILLTDIAPVFPALKHNLKRNRHLFTNTPNKKPPRHAQLYWNNKEHIAAVRPRFDIVVAADVVYMEDSALWLVDAMEGLVKEKDEGGVIVLGYQIRSVDADKVFWEKCVERFDVEKVPKENLDQDYRYEESDVFLLRKNS
ncbi:hypothetical protein ZOSMA_339G00030 [Zostera marina]|uniref:Uncharacterized protein n=1 Tax=Zostera marina TaxID=29655 RepID=A0A0K9PA48_ZOSMR|nr:hypothetical protein ZOSMA_339G00030 [Zostera marina]